MTQVFREPSGKIVVMCKGADSIIFPLLSKNNYELINTTSQYVDDYARSGLRTLLFAEKYISEDEYMSWNLEFLQAANSLDNREERLDRCAEMLENNFQLIGSTAIEDKLQDGVPQTISKIREAGIKLWVLTGDKIETAINIGYACSLLEHDMEQCMITGTTFQPLMDQIVENSSKYINKKGKKMGVIVGGDSLSVITKD